MLAVECALRYSVPRSAQAASPAALRRATATRRQPASCAPCPSMTSKILGVPRVRRITAAWRQGDSDHADRKSDQGRCPSQRHCTTVVYGVELCLDAIRGSPSRIVVAWEL